MQETCFFSVPEACARDLGRLLGVTPKPSISRPLQKNDSSSDHQSLITLKHHHHHHHQMNNGSKNQTLKTVVQQHPKFDGAANDQPLKTVHHSNNHHHDLHQASNASDSQIKKIVYHRQFSNTGKSYELLDAVSPRRLKPSNHDITSINYIEKVPESEKTKKPAQPPPLPPPKKPAAVVTSSLVPFKPIKPPTAIQFSPPYVDEGDRKKAILTSPPPLSPNYDHHSSAGRIHNNQ